MFQMAKGEDTTKFKGMYVKVKNDPKMSPADKVQALENALKKLKRMMKENNVFIDMKEMMYYVKPSEIRKNKKHKAKMRSKHIKRQNKKK